MEIEQKSYAIKIPVYVSEKNEEENGLFGPLTHIQMISNIKRIIDEYNENPINITSDKRNKTVKKEIEKVNYKIVDLNSEKAILLRITASNTNFFDGYYQAGKVELNKIILNKKDKVGSENNYILLYPKITGIESSHFNYEWIILVYGDPHKDNFDIISIAKLVLNKILNISVANVKLPELLEKINAIRVVPELQLKFSSIIYEDNDVDSSLIEYLSKSKIIRQKENTFLNVPVEKVKQIISDLSFFSKYNRKNIKITNGKNEIKILQEHLSEAQEKIKETVEEIFNQNSLIYQKDIDEKLIYNEDYIIEKLKPVLENYLMSNV